MGYKLGNNNSGLSLGASVSYRAYLGNKLVHGKNPTRKY